MFRRELFIKICCCNVDQFHLSAPKYSFQSCFYYMLLGKKDKFEEKNKSFPFTWGLNNWEITHSAQEQK